MSALQLDILETARRDMARRQLRALVIFLAVGLFLLFLAGLVLRDGETLAVTGVNFLLLAVIGWLRHRDHLTAAAFLAGAMLLASACWATWTTTWGLVDTGSVIFVATAVWAALLLPWRFFLALMALALAAVLVIGFRGPLGLAVGYDSGRTRGIDVALLVLAVVITASWVRRQNAMLWDTLHRSVEHERNLAASHTELQRRQLQVLASEQRWRSLVTAAPDWIVQLERDGTIVFANRDDHFDGDPIGCKVSDLVAESDRRQLDDAIAAALNGDAASVELNVTSRGVPRRCAFHVGPIEVEGSPNGAIVLVSDVTERHRLQEQFLQTQKLDSIGQLAGGIAHDFNNMLTVIGGHADLAQLKLGDTDPVLENIEVILRTCDHATALTRQILAFSRRQPLQPEPVDLGAAIGEMRRMLERLIGEDIRLEQSLAGSLPLIEADPGSVEQVLMNLVVNARDAVRERPDDAERSICIATLLHRLDTQRGNELGGLEPGPYVELTVSDTGVGMDAELQARAFEPFFTTKEAGRGTGLGLATVYGIVAQSGGTLQVESAPGRGTTIRIFWPTTENEIGEQPAPTPAVARVTGDEHLLVVEDDPAVRDLAANALRGLGYRVTAARDGHQALQLVNDGHAFALVITDVVMPGMNGFELRDRLPAGLPVLFSSGHTDLSWVPSGRLPNPEFFLPKPFGPRDLAKKVRYLLDSRNEF